MPVNVIFATINRSPPAPRCCGERGLGPVGLPLFWSWSRWHRLTWLLGGEWLSPPQDSLGLWHTVGGVGHAEERYTNKLKWAQNWGGKDLLHEHQSPLIEALRMLKPSNPPLLRECETVHLNTQRDAQRVSLTPGKRGSSRTVRSFCHHNFYCFISKTCLYYLTILVY